MEMNEMLNVYLYETDSLLEELDQLLLDCESSNQLDTESINTIFRIMHTIKGSSAMMEFDSLTTVAHKIEDLFAYIRENSIEQDHYEELFDLLFKSADFLKSEVELVKSNSPLSTDNIGKFEESINGFLKKISGGAKGNSAPKSSSVPATPVTVNKESAGDNFKFGLKVVFDADCKMENIRATMVLSHIENACSGKTTYAPSELDQESIEALQQNGFQIFFETQEDYDASKAIIDELNFVNKTEKLDVSAGNSPDQKEAQPAKKAPTPSKSPSQSSPGASGNAVASSIISVNLAKLDTLMNLVGELVINESTFSDISKRDEINKGDLVRCTASLRKLTKELQDDVMMLRMVSVKTVFQKMKRIVRDMSKKLDKDAELILIGEDTEVDKTIVDNLGDPLMHLVRNAMDHGVETKEKRAKTDKDPKATVTLSAENTGDEILITVKDDGQGLDKAAILQKAKERGLLTKPESEYKEKEIFNFLLQAGFSTNKQVTEFSGRGVGMDVVKKYIEDMNGSMDIESEFGKGSTMVIRIPLTLSIIDGMKYKVGNSVFTVPINNIHQTYKITKENIFVDTLGNTLIHVDDTYYPLVKLYEKFSIESDTTDLTDGIVSVIKNGDKPYCIFADEIIGEQQIVIKPVPKFLEQYNVTGLGIGGCAVLGDGTITLILDTNSLN